MSWISIASTPSRATAIPLIPPPSGPWGQDPNPRLRHISLRQSHCQNHYSLLDVLCQAQQGRSHACSRGFLPPHKAKGRARVSIFLGGSIYYPHLSTSCAAKAPVSPLPTLPNGRFSGQRLQADQTLINRSFANDSIRRTLLDRVLQSPWYQQHEMEPFYRSSKDDVTQGLDLPLEPRKDSVFKAFLSSNGKCQFGAVQQGECPKVESKLRRALGHVRFHLGHRPFVCSGCEKCANRSE